MSAPRWSRLIEFVEAFYLEPLQPLTAGVASDAISQWKHLTQGRYDTTRGLTYISIHDVDPKERMNAPSNPGFPRWRAIAQDPSGHSVWFVDAEDEAEDPPVYHWDDEGGEPTPSRECDRASEVFTWVVVDQTLRRAYEPVGESVLGRLRPAVRFLESYGPKVRAHLEGLGLEPWPVHDLALERTADGELYVSDGVIVTRTPEAWHPIEALLADEAAEREADEAADERWRADQTTRELAAKGALTEPEELLAALEAVQGELSRLDAMFLRDFRARTRAGDVLDGLRRKAVAILEKHA